MIIHGDCLEYMKTLPDKSIDLILTDPPYGINYLSPWTDNHSRIENDRLEDWQNMLPEMFTQFKRIIVPNGVCCCCCGGGGKTPVTAIFTMEAIKYFQLVQTVVWVKFIGLGWRYRPAYENIVVLALNDDYNFFDESKACSNVIHGINQQIPQKGEHPTKKPVELMERFINIHSKKGMTVLDPFMGSGTTGVACKRLEREFIGCELDENYFNIAKERIDNVDGELFKEEV